MDVFGHDVDVVEVDVVSHIVAVGKTKAVSRCFWLSVVAQVVQVLCSGHHAQHSVKVVEQVVQVVLVVYVR